MNYRSIAPLVESSRCLLFFVFDAYIISSWQKSFLPLHLQQLTYISLTIIRLIHLLSIVIWLLVWLNRTNSRCKENYDKRSLMKEDKYIDAYMENTLNYQNKSIVWIKLSFVVAIILSFTLFWAVFALRFDECTYFLTNSKVEL